MDNIKNEKDTEKLEIKISTDREGLEVIQEALDLYTRLLMGQWNELAEVMMYKGIVEYDKKEELKNELERLKVSVYEDLTEGASYGISNKKTPKESKIAYELRGVIRHELYKVEGLDSAGRDSIPPLEASGKELPNVDIIID